MPPSDTILPIRVEADPTMEETATSYAGLLPYLELWGALGMPGAVDKLVHICGRQGWLDRQIVQAMVLLNLAGGDCVSDLERLEADGGLCALVRQAEVMGMNRQERREMGRRFRGGRTRTFPAATQVHNFLEACHSSEEEAKRLEGKAFIPAPNEHLRGLQGLNRELIRKLQHAHCQTTATLDGDATLVETYTHSAKHCYEHYRAYQPFQVWWAEQQVVLHSEFRDGNVPAGHQVTRVMQEALSYLPPRVEKVFTRQDSAAYQVEFLAWCERAEAHPQVGRIEFTVSVDITPEFRGAVAAVKEWTPEYRRARTGPQATGREYAEVVFVPNAQATRADLREPLRYLAMRERLGEQLSLLEAGEQPSLPFPIITVGQARYKLSAIVTNRREEAAGELLRWHYERCGKSEEAHAIMKEDFAGGQLPSAKFGANAAWWALLVLAMNLQMVMKRLVLGDPWVKKRMKAIRFALIGQAGRLLRHARQLYVRVPRIVAEWFATLRARIRGLCLVAT